MCGFGGIVRWDGQPIDRRRLGAILSAVAHRGPDGQQTLVLDRCGLAHARLAILDLPGGAQPMQAPHCAGCAGLTVAFNGEIYNHRELRRELEARGHRFATHHCDTEVLLHGYTQWGADLPRRLDGMFAFAVWNAPERSLLLARDRIGKKPLFVRRCSGELAFASLVAALRFDGPPRLDAAALAAYLRFGYASERTLLAGVEELPAASVLVVDGTGRADARRYWTPPPTEPGLPLARPLLPLLTAAVERRLEADVPLGCFLSGGVDSSVVAALAQRKLGNLRTFHAAMPGTDYDESGKAQAVARHLGTRHTALHVEPSPDPLADLRLLIERAGEPTGDSSLLPTYWLSRAAREHVTVALSGDGGDELFAGYDRYRGLGILARHRGWIARAPALSWSEDRTVRARLGRLVRAAREAEPAQQYLRMIEIFRPEHLAAAAPDLRPDPALPEWPGHADPIDAARRWDVAHYLPCDVLRKVDRASMAVALEVRSPLLDTAVCETALRAPAVALAPRNRPKALLREVAAALLPRAIARQRKRGFGVPVGRWFRGHLQPALRDILASAKWDLNRAAVVAMIDDHARGRADHAHRLFTLLSLALWLDWLRAGKG